MLTGAHLGRSPSALAWAGLAASVVLGTAACTPSALPVPPPTSPVTVTTVPPGPVGLTASGEPTIGPGRAGLSGTVQGPSGPVPGATIEIERLVGSSAARAMLTSDAGGAWRLSGVLGGRYVIRAWLAPNLAETSPTTFFLADGVDRYATLELADPSKPLVQSAIAPDPPMTGEPTQVVVRLGSQQVQADGELTPQPAAGLTVQLIGGGWLISQPNPGVTDSQGQAVWTATCEAPGSQALQAAVSAPPATSGVSAPAGQTVAIQVAACIPAPSTGTTTTTSTTSTATVPGGTTVPTRAAGG